MGEGIFNTKRQPIRTLARLRERGKGEGRVLARRRIFNVADLA